MDGSVAACEGGPSEGYPGHVGDGAVSRDDHWVNGVHCYIITRESLWWSKYGVITLKCYSLSDQRSF